MTRLRNLYCLKIISMVLVCLLLFQFEGLLAQSREETLDKQFEKAMSEYLAAVYEEPDRQNAVYEKTVVRLKRLKAAFENIDNPNNEIICKKGQTLLLLGACLEKLNSIESIKDAGANYELAKKILGKNFKIKGLKLKGLPGYKKVKRSKVETDNVICVPGKKPGGMTKKKLLLIAGGTVVVLIAAYLLLKKKPQRTLTVSVGEGITGNPISGTYSYKKGTVVNYSYSLQPGYRELSVKLDGSDVPASGTVRMDNNHTLTVSSSREYTLTVTRGPGIDGTPETGTYTYRAGDIVNYNYSLQTGYKDLVVSLNGTTVSPVGSITMNSDHILSASAVGIDHLPEVSITYPRDGDTVSGSIFITVNASDDNGVTHVEFYIDGVQEYTARQVPYEWLWDTTAYFNGSHTIRVIAYDTANQSQKYRITVTVGN